MIDWPTLPSELEDLATMVDRFGRHVVSAQVPTIEETDAIPTALTEALVAQDLWGIGLPVDVGGGGATLAAVAVAVAELAAVDAAVGVLVATSSLLGSLPVPENALAALAAGGRLAVIDDRSPLVVVNRGVDRLDLAARRVDGGAEAGAAVVLLEEDVIFVGTDEWRGRSCGGALGRTGLRGWAPCPVAWQGEVTDLVGRSVSLRARWQLLFGAAAVGLAWAASNELHGYVTERKQFGKRLIEFGSVHARWREADRATATMVRELIWTAMELDEGAVGAPSMAADLVERAVRTATTMTAESIQLHGGYGYLAEYPTERWFRDAVTLRAVARASCPHDVPTDTEKPTDVGRRYVA